nr:MAG TPA: hypothetical protein [Caudoviricetes sp.]
MKSTVQSLFHSLLSLLWQIVYRIKKYCQLYLMV